IRRAADGGATARLRSGRALRLLDLLEEHGKGTRDDLARVPVRDFAAKKGLELPESGMALLADRELDAIALRRGRLDDGVRPARRRTDPRGRPRGAPGGHAT